MQHQVTVRYLEMTSPDQLRPASRETEGLTLLRAEAALPEWNRFFYVAVGRQWQWVERLSWSREKWLAWVDREELETWAAFHRGTPAGYFELERQVEGNVEVAYFGLLPAFTGIGLGGELLTRAVRQAWQPATRRVWLHTCTLDHPAALANYLARGFQQFREETHLKEFPDPAARAWYE